MKKETTAKQVVQKEGEIDRLKGEIMPTLKHVNSRLNAKLKLKEGKVEQSERKCTNLQKETERLTSQANKNEGNGEKTLNLQISLARRNLKWKV